MDTVEPDDGVEVDDSPTLELGDLRELQPYNAGRCALRHAERSSQLAAQPDREPTPQLGRVVLPDDVTDVVVALGAHRITPLRIVIRRYSSGTVDAVASLLSPQPDIETILLAFPSISLADLVDRGGAVGEAAQAMRDSGTYDLRALNSLRQKVAGGADADDQARRTRDARARLKESHAAEDV